MFDTVNKFIKIMEPLVDNIEDDYQVLMKKKEYLKKLDEMLLEINGDSYNILKINSNTYQLFENNKNIGTISTYTNDYHNQNCYLKFNLFVYPTYSPFSLIMQDKKSIPLLAR